MGGLLRVCKLRREGGWWVEGGRQGGGRVGGRVDGLVRAREGGS
jgi:hypothetical protein